MKLEITYNQGWWLVLEFKLNYYFEKYKDTCCISLSKFRDEFKKANGDFPLINELFIMIQKYQVKKYGDLIGTGRKFNTPAKKNEYNNREITRMIDRFGTKAERERRKWREKYGD